MVKSHSIVCVWLGVVTVLFASSNGLAKPVGNVIYDDGFTGEVLYDIGNEDDYYDSEEELPEITNFHVDLETSSPKPYLSLSPQLITHKPIYFPNTNIDMSSLAHQVRMARNKESVQPVDLPVPYIVWAKDPSGKENQMNYWQHFYNSVYKVD